jgi:hypothetical protein
VPETPAPKAVPSRPSRTPQLDATLQARYKADPGAFRRATTRNLLVVLGLFIFAVILAVFGLVDVHFASGGLALLVMAAFPFLLALTGLDEVRWRRALDRLGGTIPPRPRVLPW